jgi:hypothetical protein
VPAYETFFDKKRLPRRYFIFFDVLYQAGRHNKQLWKVVTELNKGDNMIPYGSCIFEAHVMTTVQENYYKWLFLLLSDVDEVKDEHFLEQFKMEYEYEANKLPKDLIDYHKANSRLTQEVEIYFDENEEDKTRLFKVATGDDKELFYDRERCELEMLVEEVREKHQNMIELMKRKIRDVRSIKNDTSRVNAMSDDDMKKLISVEKKKLIQFRNNEDNGSAPPENKKRRTSNDHRSRCSDLKVQFFQSAKERLDQEEKEGLITSWEKVYKYILNHHIVEEVETEPVMGEPSKMLTEFNKVVDLDEIIAQAVNKENTAINQASSWTAL